MSQITSGTVDVTTGSPTVTAALGVDWGAVSLPALFNVQGDPGVLVYDITAVNAPAPGDRYTLTLGAPYAGASADNVAYAISRDFTPVLGLPLLNPGDVNTAGLFNRAMRKLDGQIVVATGPQGIQGEAGLSITSVEVIGVDETGTTIRIHYGVSSSIDVVLPSGMNGADGGVGPEGPQGPAGPGITSITVLDASHIRIFYGEASSVDVELPAGPPGEDGRGIVSIANTGDPTVALVTFTDATTSDLNLPPGATGATGTDGVGWWVTEGEPTTIPPNGTYAFDTTNGDVWRYTSEDGWAVVFSTAGPQGIQGETGVGISSISQSGDQIEVHLTDGGSQGPFFLPSGATGAAGANSTVPGPPGDTGLGISSITQPTPTTLLVTYTDTTTEGPFDLPGGDMTRAVYDPQEVGHISGLSNGSDGGVLNMDAGNSDGTAGGGGVYTQGGTVSGAYGGSFNAHGNLLPGGGFYSFDGGGTVNTRETGLIELGFLGTRTTVTGTATEDRAQTTPDRDGEFMVKTVDEDGERFQLGLDSDSHRITFAFDQSAPASQPFRISKGATTYFAIRDNGSGEFTGRLYLSDPTFVMNFANSALSRDGATGYLIWALSNGKMIIRNGTADQTFILGSEPGTAGGGILEQNNVASAPATRTDGGTLYWKAVSGVSHLFAKRSDGTEVDMTP